MKRQASSWVGPPRLKPPLTTIPSHLPSIQDFIGEVKNIIVAPCDNLTLDSGRLMGYSGIMKTFTVIGRVWTRGHGYLATRCQMDFEAKNKSKASSIKLGGPAHNQAPDVKKKINKHQASSGVGPPNLKPPTLSRKKFK